MQSYQSYLIIWCSEAGWPHTQAAAAMVTADVHAYALCCGKLKLVGEIADDNDDDAGLDLWLLLWLSVLREAP